MKAPFVTLARPEDGAGAQNSFLGTVTRRLDAEPDPAAPAAAKSEILVDIGAAKTMTAVVPRRVADELGLHEGMQIRAAFDPGHVILAAD